MPALAENIKQIRPHTLEGVQKISGWNAIKTGMESGQKIRTDATATETNTSCTNSRNQSAKRARHAPCASRACISDSTSALETEFPDGNELRTSDTLARSIPGVNGF